MAHQPRATTDDEPTDRLTEIAAVSLQYDELPDWDTYRTSAWAVEDSIKQVINA